MGRCGRTQIVIGGETHKAAARATDRKTASASSASLFWGGQSSLLLPASWFSLSLEAFFSAASIYCCSANLLLQSQRNDDENARPSSTGDVVSGYDGATYERAPLCPALSAKSETTPPSPTTPIPPKHSPPKSLQTNEARGNSKSVGQGLKSHNDSRPLPSSVEAWK